MTLTGRRSELAGGARGTPGGSASPLDVTGPFVLHERAGEGSVAAVFRAHGAGTQLALKVGHDTKSGRPLAHELEALVLASSPLSPRAL